jgi:hypothetical protein
MMGCAQGMLAGSSIASSSTPHAISYLMQPREQNKWQQKQTNDNDKKNDRRI